ncbi:hypothetical protein [Leptospira harrisiae]|uniref:Uncharacterized protein n=1 Tax=Leptospira harrisiae TaxID=2023189 RepID=A0A2N0AHI8_9LEPT|nr:hypothetical protein [Leptospira harrisiae]PJZ83768.1 hypothetical protein CH364_13420 [Leptospira harrisiae]PKA07777.1 hypothetical protein CH366_15525 [Leptospira harrisiae]
MPISRQILKILLFLIYPILLYVSVHFGNRNDFGVIFAVAFVLPLYFYFLSDIVSLFGNRFLLFWSYGIFLRVVVIGSPAVWSDDIYRYLFDAKLLLNGISPYHHTPREIMGLHNTSNLGLDFLFLKMNSPDYYSVYPLLLQCFFSLGTLVGSLFANSLVGVQIMFVLFECINLCFIRKLYPDNNNKTYWLYFGNPLVIIEGVSQMHPEILLVTGCLFLLVIKIYRFDLFSFFLLTQLKFNVFLFALGFRGDKKDRTILLLLIIFSLLIWKITVFSEFMLQGSAGIGLFFHSFRFAGILEPFFYFILSLFRVEYLSGVISFSVLGLTIVYLLKQNFFKKFTLVHVFLILYSMFLLFSPVVHPWYWILWVFFLVGNNKAEWIVSIIAFLAFLSYGLYVYYSFVYIHWMISILILGFYGYKQINHLRKTT